ncbi:hypothetical protein PN36_24210 [Candidatus Thiomargarita nelsonii]|uniref:Uncharacterized protein n=1 Tax=Candidatus Thiomargarita nelsonii TaxID=1003181 RepID=A0A0A6RLV6_9GAMM|nr:hypothetical protein PN36_24210 [Candidatus Thiomargarita nelsonii]
MGFKGKLCTLAAPRYHTPEQPLKDCDRAIRAPNIDLETFRDAAALPKLTNSGWIFGKSQDN